jgi:hypothetical protein
MKRDQEIKELQTGRTTLYTRPADGDADEEYLIVDGELEGVRKAVYADGASNPDKPKAPERPEQCLQSSPEPRRPTETIDLGLAHPSI